MIAEKDTDTETPTVYFPTEPFSLLLGVSSAASNDVVGHARAVKSRSMRAAVESNANEDGMERLLDACAAKD